MFDLGSLAGERQPRPQLTLCLLKVSGQELDSRQPLGDEHQHSAGVHLVEEDAVCLLQHRPRHVEVALHA